MARAYPIPDVSDLAPEPQAGEWQALRGELVSLLDQVEGRYAGAERAEPALSGISRRVRNLRDQVVGPEPAALRREALRTVKRAVDRFSERDDFVDHGERDALSDAIAEIRGRQMSSSAAALGQRAGDQPEFRELSALVRGLSGRLERLEGDLHKQRATNGSVSEVASQVEQLTHVVELLAGAVGETGQVKRLEAQIGALAALIESGPKVDLTSLNRRLDDVSTTVGKLAELQAQQMEREIAREERGPGKSDSVAPAMQAIEASVRTVYDRIDSIERNVALSSGEFERLTSEMAAFTQVMKDSNVAPDALVAKIDDIASRIGGFQSSNRDVAGLKQDIASLRDAVVAGMEPRFLRIESQIEALSDRMPADGVQVESQLKLLMQRMDEASNQLNGLAKLYSANQSGPVELEAMATLVAERTSDAITRKAPAPVAMFGPDSLKSIEDRITGLIKSAGKTPDYESLAELVAERTSEAIAKSAPQASSGVSEESMGQFEKRMTALFNTAGKDTAERLTRLEAALSERARPSNQTAAPQRDEGPNSDRFDAMLSALSGPRSPAKSDAMPANPADDAPLVDPGFRNEPLLGPALQAKVAARPPVRTAEPRAAERPLQAPIFDPASVERPPRPQSSFASDSDPFAPPPASAAPSVEAPAPSNTSTFVAAARRAQRARQETVAAPASVPSSNSLIGRALSRVMPATTADAAATTADAPIAPPAKPEKAAKPAKPSRQKKDKPAKPVAADAPVAEEATEARPSFLRRHRRPLLLAATLVAVSMLALNLVLQRMDTAAPAPAAEAPAAPAPVAPSEDVSLVRPEARISDMIDTTATGSIGSPEPMSFSKSAPVGPARRTILASAAAPASATPAALVETPAAKPAELAASAEPETFDLPPEAVGPLELRQAAADGDARAQFEIGAIYTEGQALPQDYAEAGKWYERSAAQGFAPAQYRLGNLYEAGNGVEKDLEVAKLWYQRAAEAGNRMAMHNLAALYAGGSLGEQEFEQAAEWFAQAAGKGMTDSQFNLGMLYARGLGVEQDFARSYKWFALAAASGDKDAAQARDDMAKSLTAEQVSTVSAEVAAWKPETLDLAANFAPLGSWSPSFDPGAPITTKEVVSKVQLVLGKLGFDVGTADGFAGPKTAEAIKAFERGTGMSEIGAINPRLLAVLGSQPV